MLNAPKAIFSIGALDLLMYIGFSKILAASIDSTISCARPTTSQRTYNTQYALSTRDGLLRPKYLWLVDCSSYSTRYLNYGK